MLKISTDSFEIIVLRELFEDIQPGYHMNKAQWNSVYFGGGLPRYLECELINHSYELVVAGLFHFPNQREMSCSSNCAFSDASSIEASSKVPVGWGPE